VLIPANSRLFLLIAWLVVVVGSVAIPQPASAQDDARSLTLQAKSLLARRCFECHGANGVARKNVFVLDRARLISAKTVIPGDDKSLLLRLVETGAMPLGGPTLTEEEKNVLRKWILAGAPDWEEINIAAARREFITESAIAAFIHDDLLKADERSRPYLRYFSLAHLHNAGAPDQEMGIYRAALSKLINSLSWHREITQPAPVDDAKIILRIDLRDYAWTERTWNVILASYPYGVITREAERITRFSTASPVYVRADWFVANASAPPLYHDLLGLPANIGELERLLGVDTARNLAEEKNVARAGVRASGVSHNNRVLERHVSPHGAYWKSFDFRSNLENQNIFKDPIRLNPAGGEIIFNLPNGFQAYFLIDAFGRRINEAPIEIVSNRADPDDPVIENGRSCMNCHFNGMQSFTDDVRPVVQGMTIGFFERDRALALYPPQETVDRLIEKDRQRFETAVQQAGGRPVESASGEPISALSRRFFADLSVAQAAAETGLDTREFQARVSRSALLISLGFGQLMIPQGGFKRDGWEKNFGAMTRELRLGNHIPPRAAILRRAPAAQRGEISWREAETVLNNPALNNSASNNSGVAHSRSSSAEPEAIMRVARTVFVRSKSLFLKSENLENELHKRSEFTALGLTMVRDRRKADIEIEINRPPFTFVYAFTLTNPETSVVLTDGKVTAFDGTFAAPKIAKEILKRIAAARSLTGVK
jgi:mono/diheme cytochrome c family protein